MNPKVASRTQPEAGSQKPIAFGSTFRGSSPLNGIYWLSLTYDSYRILHFVQNDGSGGKVMP